MRQWTSASDIIENFPASLKPWLLHADSMTQRMKASANTYRIEVVEEAWRKPAADVRHALHITPNELVWFREVEIYCDEQIVMRAESYFTKSVTARFGIVKLGEKPLGEVVFAHPNIQRSDFEFAFDENWKRQSTLKLDNSFILLRESFIPSSLYGYDYS